jgi:hypothetical protein
VCFCRNCANPVSVVDKVGPDVLMSWAARDWDLAFDITFLPGRGFADPLFERFWRFSERTGFLLRSRGFDLPMSVVSVVLQWPRRGHQGSFLGSRILEQSIPSWETGKPARPRASRSLRVISDQDTGDSQWIAWLVHLQLTSVSWLLSANKIGMEYFILRSVPGSCT